MKPLLRNAVLALSGLMVLVSSIVPAKALENAGTLLVELDARNASAGTVVWKSTGTLGDFRRVGNPRVEELDGIRAVMFDGKADAYVGPKSVPAIEKRGKRSIEVWAFNPTVDAPEETVLSWGARGGPLATVLSLNYGDSAQWGAVTHWGADLSWGRTPTAGRWHYLVYTYDGNIARIYADGILRGQREVALATTANHEFVLAAQHAANGALLFANEADHSQIGGSLAVAVVRIHDGVLSPEQIVKNFQADAALFHATLDLTFQQMLERVERHEATDLVLTLLPGNQVVAGLSPKGSAFNFTPGDRLEQRLAPKFYNLGDVSLRVRTVGTTEWKSYTSANKLADIKAIPPGTALVAADITPSLGRDCPVRVERRWVLAGKHLALRFKLKNMANVPVQLGAFGAAMVFNNDFSGRRLEETHEKCSLADPYVGGEAGYLQVTRVNGAGPVLLVVPEKGTSFEAYRPLRDDPTPVSVTCEGFYEWMVHTEAYAENEWKKAREWNEATERSLTPGEEVTYGFEFMLAPEIRKIEDTLLAQGRPVAVGVPGYVLPLDQTGRLFLNGASAVTAIKTVPENVMVLNSVARRTPGGWQEWMLSGKQAGWCRVEVSYADGTKQFIHYNITSASRDVVQSLAHFHETKQWFADEHDPFHRAYSYMPWDREANSMMLEETHVWNVGLSDECGAGANLLMAMKNALMPEPTQVHQLEQYVDHALWGDLQSKTDYGIKASLFYYDPKTFPDYYHFNYGGWAAWDKARSETTWRAYNYPHQAAIYWSLYKLARNTEGLVTAHPWDWYLRQAWRTVMAMRDHSGRGADLGFAQFGLMDGSVFLEILKDLQREGWQTEARTLESYMRTRAEHWRNLRYPFGSEMPWDSTGQEEVYQWCKYFGFVDQAKVSLQAILAYTPNVPNWGYDGSARRYFDVAVYGKRPEIVREAHHYGASLNAIPLLDSYRADPDDFYLLRIGYAGAVGILTDVNAEGHGSMAFLMDPAIMDWEPYSGDYGCAFFGHAYNSGCYVVKHPELGWLCFGGDLQEKSGRMEVTPKDSFHTRLYVAPLKTFVTVEGGTFEHASLDLSGEILELTLSPSTEFGRKALLRVESGGLVPSTTLKTERGGYVVELEPRGTRVTLKKNH